MPRFMDVHHGMKGLTAEKLEEAHKRDQEHEQGTGVHFIKAWADPESGSVFCLSEGPDKEAVKHVHERAGHAPDEIYEIRLETN